MNLQSEWRLWKLRQDIPHWISGGKDRAVRDGVKNELRETYPCKASGRLPQSCNQLSPGLLSPGPLQEKHVYFPVHCPCVRPALIASFSPERHPIRRGCATRPSTAAKKVWPETAKTGPVVLSLAFLMRIWKGSMGPQGVLRGF